MANEITSSTSLTVTKNGATFNASANKTFTQTGNVALNAVQNIGTAAELVSLGDITGVPGAMLVKNLDTTNFIEISLDSGGTQIFAKLTAGKGMLWFPSVAAVYAKSDTAACRLQVLAIEV
jgi:hypothetical protein